LGGVKTRFNNGSDALRGETGDSGCIESLAEGEPSFGLNFGDDIGARFLTQSLQVNEIVDGKIIKIPW